MSQNVSLQMAAEGGINLEMMQMPMRISDAASMLRRTIPKNDPPYQAEVKKLNNRRVDEWYERVLLKIADKNACVPAGRVNGCLQYFLEGKELERYQKYKHQMVQYPEEMVKFWIDIFMKSTIAELHEIGSGVIGNGWNIIKGALRNHFAEEKWKVVYSHSEDPLQWDKLANDNPNVMNGRPVPFGLRLEDLRDMETKVRAILELPIEPR